MVAKQEEESASLESHEKIKDEVVKTLSEMTLWVVMDEELKNEKMTPTSEVDDDIIQLNNKLKGTIVKKKKKENI